MLPANLPSFPLQIVLCLATGAMANGCVDPDTRPIGSGGTVPGTGGTGGTGPDANPQDTPTGIVGTLCVVSDLRQPTRCDEVSDLSGIVVKLNVDSNSTLSTTSNTQGGFVLPVSLEPMAQATLQVVAPEYKPLLFAIVVDAEGMASNVVVPLIRNQSWQDILSASGVAKAFETATIAIFVERNGSPANGVVLVPPLGTLPLPLYDASSPTRWLIGGATGIFGGGLLLGIPTLDAETSVLLQDGGPGVTVSGIPVQRGMLTVIRAELP